MLKHTSYLASFWCPLEIRDGSDIVIWKNPVPNGVATKDPKLKDPILKDPN